MKRKDKVKENREIRAILEKLFPEGIDDNKIWNGFITIVGDQVHERLSIERLETYTDRKFKLKKRISRHFPGVADKFRLIYHGDMDLLHHLTQRTWVFADSHKVHSKNAIVLHGDTLDQVLLDWAAQAVVTLLLKQIKVNPWPADKTI